MILDCAMPRKVEWFCKLERIEKSLGRLAPDGLLDRAAIEEIFGVSRRQATRILVRVGSVSVGGARVISCENLVCRLKLLRENDAVVFERTRRERLHQQLEVARQELQSKRIPIPLTLSAVHLEALPAAIHLGRGELSVQFLTPMELLQNLMLLVQAISEDFGVFESMTARLPPPASGAEKQAHSS
jgi:hypothetical protein